MIKFLAVPLILLLSASPALALNCYGAGGAGIGFGLEFSFGEMSEQDEADLDLMRLRREGVDASSVEYWNGCIRAWVPNENGRGQHMEFYDPRTLRRVED